MKTKIQLFGLLLIFSLVAGCLGGETQTTATTQPAGGSAPARTFIAKTADVPAGSSVDFTYNGDNAILVNFGGKYVAYVNKCTHKGCATKFSGDALACPCHGSKYNPANGEVINGPAPSPLTPIDIVVSGDSIYTK
jgi:nitrite reductase/ring-hydroxylating ferredoxin subunit